MTQSSDKHDSSAEALKALAATPRDGSDGSADGFVGPDEAEVLEEGSADPVEGAAADPAAYGFAEAPQNGPPLSAAEIAAPDPRAHRRRAEEFDRRARKAHAHQYKTIMIPLLITLGVILLLMGLYVVLSSDGGPARAADPVRPARPIQQGSSGSFQSWFPFLAFPLGAFLLVGAWWFHRDVNRKK